VTGAILTPLKEMMHAISSGLLAPTIAILLLFVAFMVIELGGLLVEFLMERRKVKVKPARVAGRLSEERCRGDHG